MKHWIRILSLAIIVLAILFSVAYVYVGLEGKAILVRQLENFTHRKVSVGYFDLSLPLNLEMRNLDIQGLGKVESLYVSFSPLYLLTARIALNQVRITRPEVTLERFPPKTAEPPPQEKSAGSGENSISKTAQPVEKPDVKSDLNLIFKRLAILDGRLNFIDHTVGANEVKITVNGINFNLTNLYPSRYQAIASFELKGKVPWQEGKEQGKIQAEGWLNFHKKDMQATLNIQDIDGVYLYPYYAQWVDLEKARIESAKLNFSSNIQGLNDNVTADCHIELSDIISKPRAAEESEDKAEKIRDFVLELFKALDKGKIELNFTIKTKMSRPEFGFGNIKTAVEEKITEARGKTSGFKPQDIFVLPGSLLSGTVKSVAELSKALIIGTFAVGNEFKNALGDSFRKEPKEQQ
jgi:hypothetical protein